MLTWQFLLSSLSSGKVRQHRKLIGLGLHCTAAGDGSVAGVGFGLHGTAAGDGTAAGIGLGLVGIADGDDIGRHSSWCRSWS